MIDAETRDKFIALPIDGNRVSYTAPDGKKTAAGEAHSPAVCALLAAV